MLAALAVQLADLLHDGLHFLLPTSARHARTCVNQRPRARGPVCAASSLTLPATAAPGPASATRACVARSAQRVASSSTPWQLLPQSAQRCSAGAGAHLLVGRPLRNRLLVRHAREYRKKCTRVHPSSLVVRCPSESARRTPTKLPQRLRESRPIFVTESLENATSHRMLWIWTGWVHKVRP